ncbi:MAG TPA: FIST N-terminal domain-containing protein [Candidatus Binataceae bacterium]|nr:FIST N-terminal domain-containing protein [Candidatus Binataceae bacterium]
MLHAGVGWSVLANPRTAAIEATRAALKQAGLRAADSAICFASSSLGGAFPLLVRTVAETAGTREIAGCASRGVIAGGREIEAGASVAVLVFGGDTLRAHRLFVPQLRGRGRETAEELAAFARPFLEGTNLLCLFPDSYNFDADPFLTTLARELPGVSVVGGGATEDGSVGETFQFCGDVVSSNSVAGMLISGDFEINTGAALACAPLGAAHRVTAVRENIILELDGRSAYEVFAAAAGPLAADLRRALAFVFLGVPLESGGERLQRGHFYVRNIIGASEEHGAIAVAHRPALGDTVGFVLRDGERSRNELKVTLEALQTGLKNPPGFGLYFDCISRGAGLYNIPDHDSAYIGQFFPQLPVAGFFTGLEIGPLGSGTGLLQYSGVLALVSERP